MRETAAARLARSPPHRPSESTRPPATARWLFCWLARLVGGRLVGVAWSAGAGAVRFLFVMAVSASGALAIAAPSVLGLASGMELDSLQWRRSIRPFWHAYRLWLRADCDDLSAAFAYHTLQSFFPALLIVLALVSRLLGREPQLLERLLDLVARVLPVSALPGFEATLDRFTRQGVGAGILGIVLLVLSASNIYLTLQRGADRLWWNRPFGFDGLSWQQIVVRFLALRVKALLLLLVVGLLIVLDQLINSLRFLGSAVMRDWLLQTLALPWLRVRSVSMGVDVGLSVLISFIAALIFLWLLPSRRIPIRPLIPGALLVSLAITLLNLILGRSLVLLGLRFQAYGVVGGVLALTLWVWLVGVILYYGQCLSVVLAGRSPGGHSTLRANQPQALRRPG